MPKYKTGSEILESSEWKNGDPITRRKIFLREVASQPDYQNASGEMQAKIYERFRDQMGFPPEEGAAPAEVPSVAPAAPPVTTEVAPAAAVDLDSQLMQEPNPVNQALENQLFGQDNLPPAPLVMAEEPAPPAGSILEQAIRNYPYTLGGGLVGLGFGTAEAASGAKGMLSNLMDGAPPATSGEKWLRNWAGMERELPGGVPAGAAAYQRSKLRGQVGKSIQQKYGPEASKKALLSIEGWMREQQMLRDLAEKASKAKAAETASKMLGRVPLGSTLTGASSALDVAEGLRRYRQGDVGGAGLSGLSALGQAGMLLPHPVPRLGGAALTLGTMPAEYIYRTLEENRRRAGRGLAPVSKGQAEIQYDPTGMPIR